MITTLDEFFDSSPVHSFDAKGIKEADRTPASHRTHYSINVINERTLVIPN